MTIPVDLSIVIVSWNVWDLLAACLRSVEHASRPIPGEDARLRAFGPPDGPAPSLEVIVFDNASHDATADQLPVHFPWVHFVRSERNLGFTGGNNQGYAASRGRFVYFLNPDTELVDGGLWTLFAAVARDPAVAAAGPELRYADGARQSSRRRFPTPLTGFFESTWLGRAWPGNPWARRLQMAGWPEAHRHDVDWVVGAALLARRASLEQVRMPAYAGPFDEGFFMYSEELDLCKRLKGAGGRVIYVPEARVVHHEGRSSEQVVASRHIHFNTSKVYYYEKTFGHRWAEVLRRYLLLEFRWQLGQERVKWLLGHKRNLRAARIEAYQQVLASRLLPPSPSSSSS